MTSCTILNATGASCCAVLCCRLFLIEGIVAVIVSASFFFLPKDIDHFKSLTAEEKDALHASMKQHCKTPAKAWTLLVGAVKNPAVWIAGAGIKFMRDMAFYGLMYWLPLIIKSLLPRDLNTQRKQLYSILLTAVPFACSAGKLGWVGGCGCACCHRKQHWAPECTFQTDV